jgi:hypothetical protein
MATGSLEAVTEINNNNLSECKELPAFEADDLTAIFKLFI